MTKLAQIYAITKINKNNSLEHKTILILPEELNPPINNENSKIEDDSLEK